MGKDGNETSVLGNSVGLLRNQCRRGFEDNANAFSLENRNSHCLRPPSAIYFNESAFDDIQLHERDGEYPSLSSRAVQRSRRFCCVCSCSIQAQAQPRAQHRRSEPNIPSIASSYHPPIAVPHLLRPHLISLRLQNNRRIRILTITIPAPSPLLPLPSHLLRRSLARHYPRSSSLTVPSALTVIVREGLHTIASPAIQLV